MTDAISDLFDVIEQSSDRILPGVVIAVVTDNNDPDKLGRVKLKFVWNENDDEPDWARIATIYVGKSRGSFFIPEIDDQVLVIFENGDINRPIVIGSLWNEQDIIPEQTGENGNNIKKIVTRSNHVVTFDDTDSSEKIEIKSKSGHVVTLDDASGKELVSVIDKTGKNLLKIDSTDNSITISCDGDLKISADNITIDAKGKISMSAGGEFSAKSTGNMDIQSSGSLSGKSLGMTLKSDSTMSVEGSMTAIKGSTIVNIN